MPDPPRASKGVMIVTLRSYVMARFGQDGWGRVTERVRPEDRALLPSVVAVGWYPTALAMGCLEAFAAELVPSDPDLLTDFGFHGAESDLTIFHRAFLRMANPAFVVEKTGQYWGKFHTHGTWLTERRPRGMTLALSDFEGCATYCATLTPYIRRLLELVGARNVTTAHPECRNRGGAACVWTGGWA